MPHAADHVEGRERKISPEVFGPDCGGNPDLQFFRVHGKHKAAWHHAHYRVNAVIQLDGLAQY